METQLISVYWFLYPAILLNLYINSNRALLESLGFSMHKIIICKQRRFYFFFNFDAFYFFLLPNCSGWTSSTMLNRDGRSGHPYLITNLRGKTVSISLLNMMLAMSLLYKTFVILTYVPSILNLLRGLFFCFVLFLTSLLEYNCFTMVC